MSNILNSKIRLDVPHNADGAEVTITNSKGNVKTITMMSPITDIMVSGMEQYRIQTLFTDVTITLGYGQIKKVHIFDTSWSTSSDEECISMLNKHRNGTVNIQDYWHIGDVRPVKMPYVSPASGTYNVGPMVAHDNGLKLAKFGDSKSIVSGNNKAIICVFAQPSPNVNISNIFDSDVVHTFYANMSETIRNGGLGSLTPYLRTFKKYYTYYNGNRRAIYIDSVYNTSCCGLSCLDILPVGTSGISDSYLDPLPAFPDGKAYPGSQIVLMDYYYDYKWACGTNASGVPSPTGYISRTSAGFAGAIVI